jgi:phosphate transport system protein
MTKNHTNKAYEHELRLLRDRILLIAGRVEKMVATSIRALSLNDTALARETIDYDKNIDRDEMVIDRQCIELLARRQPLGEDLRFIVSVIKMVTYFERMGDLAVKISHRVIKLKHSEIDYSIDGLEGMARGVQTMIKDTVEAFLLRDSKKASHVIKQDETIDSIYHLTTKRYIKEMTELGQDIESHFHLLSIAKWLERMGDHCVKLAKLIIFMVMGEDVRHQTKMSQKIMETV